MIVYVQVADCEDEDGRSQPLEEADVDRALNMIEWELRYQPWQYDRGDDELWLAIPLSDEPPQSARTRGEESRS